MKQISDENNQSERPYIDFLNKEIGFKPDRKYFDTYEEAVAWGQESLENFNKDMIRYE